MAYTQADIDAIDRALALGAVRVVIDGQDVTYASTDELLRRRDHILRELSVSATRRPRATYSVASFSDT